MVFPRVKRIEGLLEDRWGASGRGLHEKLSSVEHKVDSRIISRGRFIASVRNKVAHEDGYRLDDREGFKQACEEVEDYLRTAPLPAPRPVSRPASVSSTVASVASPARVAPPAAARPKFDYSTALTFDSFMQEWRGTYGLWMWLGAALYFGVHKLRNLTPDTERVLYGALFLTLLTGMQTFLTTDDHDTPNAFALLLVGFVALFLALSVGNIIGGLSGGLLVFVGSLVVFYLLLTYATDFLAPLIKLFHWISRGLYKLVTYSTALTVVGGLIWLAVRFFVSNWKPA